MFCCWCDQFYELFPTLVTKEGSRKFSMRETVSISAFCYKVGACDFITVHNEVAKVMFLHVSVCPQGGVPGQVSPWDQVHPSGTRYILWDQVHPLRTRYTPQNRYTSPTRYTPGPGTTPWGQVHPPGTRYTTPGPGILPQTRYTPRPGTPLGPGTPTQPGTPPQDQVQ